MQCLVGLSHHPTVGILTEKKAKHDTNNVQGCKNTALPCKTTNLPYFLRYFCTFLKFA